MTASAPSALTAALAGRYTVEREVGRGGMATVYLARDDKHGRPVAIKVLRAELAASVNAERFLREIGIAARLTHPHVVPLIDSGDAGGFLYYVCPYVAGGSLRERLRETGRVPLADALRIAREVGTALDYAHRQGVVHRDVKPENILLADGLALLADFGVARAAGESRGSGSSSAGMAVGTPEYMSPEQAAGEGGVDSRADQYGLACVIYEMLAGEPPFSGGPARAVMASQVALTPLPVRAARPDAPPAVEGALARALAKDPAKRFPTVQAFLDALTAADAPARPYGATRRIAVLPFVNGGPDPDQEYLSDGITDELIDALSKVEGLQVSSRTSVFALKGKAQDVRAIGALLGVTVVLEGTLRRAGDRLRITAQLTSADDGRLLWSQRYDRAFDDVFGVQEEIARTIVTTLRATLFADLEAPRLKRYTENAEAYRLYLKGRFAWNKRTPEGVTEAIAFFERAIAADPRYALAYTGLADSYALQIDYRSVPVDEGFARAETYARRALELDDTLAEAHASLAWALFIHDWAWDAAAREFQRAIELDPRYATARQWHAFLLASCGRLDDAIVEAHTALELDPASVSIRRSIGWIYFYARRFEQAQHHLTRAVAMNPLADETLRVLGLTLALHGRPAEGERALREAVDLPGAGTYTRATLGYVLARAGRRDEAQAILDELTARATRGYVSPVAFATLHLGLGEREAALDWAERCFADRRGWLAYLRVNPLFDPVRDHPRFAALVERMRFPA